MDAEAHERLSSAERGGLVLVGCCADMVINYPVWILAKRWSAGLGSPKGFGEYYKGATSLLFSYGPMMLVEDHTTGLMVRSLDGVTGSQTAAHFAAACFSGAVGAVTIGAQIEGVITRAHATGETVFEAAKSMVAARGIASIAAPYGALAMAGREIPFAGAVFCLSGLIRAQLRAAWPTAAESSGSSDGSGGASVLRDLFGASIAACVAGPLSQPPSVVAAHQQAHQVSIGAACRKIYTRGGYRGFFSGLVPRTASIAGTTFVMTFVVESLQPIVERYHEENSSS